MANEKAKLSIKPCPICGNTPYLEKEAMTYENGYHNYRGSFNYRIKCDICHYPREQFGDTVGHTDEQAREIAITGWNTEADKIEAFLSHRK